MSPTLVFIDTSAFKAYYDEKDDFHQEARNWMNDIAKKKLVISGFVTTDYILDETITLVRLAHSHEKATEFAGAALASRILRIVYIDEERFLAALELFRRRRDKLWSFTDCASFCVMESIGIRSSFSFDANFKEAGFTIMPGL